MGDAARQDGVDTPTADGSCPERDPGGCQARVADAHPFHMSAPGRYWLKNKLAPERRVSGVLVAKGIAKSGEFVHEWAANFIAAGVAAAPRPVFRMGRSNPGVNRFTRGPPAGIVPKRPRICRKSRRGVLLPGRPQRYYTPGVGGCRGAEGKTPGPPVRAWPDGRAKSKR